MNQYFFNVTNEERENILDKHKTIYDGYVTQYGSGNMTPLTVVDMAKDKGGVTVNSRGEVSEYKNYGINESINEMRFDNKSTGLFSNEEDGYNEEDSIDESDSLPVGPPLDMIADREYDVKHGTVDFDGEIDFFDLGDIIPFEDEDFEDEEFNIDLTQDDDESNDDEFSIELGANYDDEDAEPIMEQVKKSLDMFKRFKKYN